MTTTLHARIKGRVGNLAIDVELDTTGGTLVVIGPNGAGKTSALSLLLGVLPVAEGRITVDENVLLDTAKNICAPPEHRRLGYVPQDYALFPHMNVRENIEFATGSQSLEATTKTADIDGLLRDLGLQACSERRIGALSGGEKQRVALARALSVNPRALLLDEPLAALDVHSRCEVRNFLAAYLARLALPTIVVTHDAADARQLGHRIAVLEGGRITQTGTWDDLVAQPTSQFVAAFVKPSR